MAKIASFIISAVLFLIVVGFILASTPGLAAVFVTIMLTWTACDIHKWILRRWLGQ